jgi:TolB-like protein/Flp pilus assembly protein TadD
MAKFLAELKRRQMFRVAAAYAVLAWLLLQIVNNVAPILDLPPWVARAFLLAFIVGLPVALFFAWMRELAPSDATGARASTSKIDYALMAAVVLVIALVSYQQLVPSIGSGAATQATVSPPAGTQNPAAGISIAVLPFANLSDEREQEFFSDGMTDEIMTALAKIQKLSVVARESAFQYKGERNDMRVVGQALNAQYLINGSVRRAGNRVRITAQLVRSNDGVGLWTDNYDRELTDIFAIQEEIAQAIAGALSVPLGLQQGQQLVSSRTGDLDSYQQHLRARALLRANNTDAAVALLEPLVARDRNYAPAWALLALAYTQARFRADRASSPDDARRIWLPALDKSEQAAIEAVRADPSYAGGYARLGAVARFRGDWAASDDLRRQALMLDPSDPETLQSYSQGIANAGRLREALRLAEQLRAVEPFVPGFSITTAVALRQNGQSQAAIRILESLPLDAQAAYRNTTLAEAYAAAGRYSEAADTLLAIPEDSTEVSRQTLLDAARLLRSAPANASAPETLPSLEGLTFVYWHVGAPERLIESWERRLEFLGALQNQDMWYSEYAPLRKTDRFKTLMRNAGLLDYWRARGWPDLCRPVGADDFECD